MSTAIPDYLRIPPQGLSVGHQVRLQVVEGMPEVAQAMAQAMLDSIQQSLADRGRAVLIIPVGPVDQFPILAQLVNDQRVSLKDVVLMNMDEYLTDDDHWVPWDHPLSFRAYMQRSFYDRLDSDLRPPVSQQIFPDPQVPGKVQQVIDYWGGVDVCFAGIGINGHLAFNEPPEPGEEMGVSEFAQLPTRVLDLSRETRTINSNTVGGSIEVIPRRCVTVGMKEILASRRLEVFCNRPWQAAVIRRVLHGPVSAACPASLIRRHPAARVTMASYVAEIPQIQLR